MTECFFANEYHFINGILAFLMSLSSSTEYPANKESEKYENKYLAAVMAVGMSILFSGAVPAQGSDEKSGEPE